MPVRVWAECYGNIPGDVWSAEKIDRTLAVFETLWTPMSQVMGSAMLDGPGGGDDAIDVSWSTDMCWCATTCPTALPH